MFKDLVFKNYYYSSLVLSVLSAILIFIFKGMLPPVVPLLYGSPVGDGQLVPGLGLLLAPGVSLGITIGNMFLSRGVKDIFFKRILAISSVLVAILATITVVKIFFLVGYF